MTSLDLSTKTISQIANIVNKAWAKVSPHAAPYLDAMASIESINDSYYADSAYSVVAYFLSNASQFKGDTARVVKNELKNRMKQWEKENN